MIKKHGFLRKFVYKYGQGKKGDLSSMKKIIIGVFVLLLSTFCFAENISIFGITFGMTKQEIKKFDLDKRVETPMETALDHYARDIEVEVLYDKNDKVNCIRIYSRFGEYAEMFQAYWMAFFMEKLNCKHIENVYYNENIVACIYHTYDKDGDYEGTYIDIGELKEFSEIMERCVKGQF